MLIEVVVDDMGRGAVQAPVVHVDGDVELVWLCLQAGVGPLRLLAEEAQDDDLTFVPFAPPPPAAPSTDGRADLLLAASTQMVQVIRWRPPRAGQRRTWVYRILVDDRAVDMRDAVTGLILLREPASTAGSSSVSVPR